MGSWVQTAKARNRNTYLMLCLRDYVLVQRQLLMAMDGRLINFAVDWESRTDRHRPTSITQGVST